MSSPRSLLAVAGGVFVVILASLGGTAYVLLRTRPLAERLVAEANALARTKYPRPSHVTPALPGTFGEHLEPLMGELLGLYRARGEPFRSRDLPGFPCSGVIEGREPVSALPSACREELEKGREWVARVLAATHAEAGGVPEWMRNESPPPPHSEPDRQVLLYVVRRAALETRLLLAEGRAAEAVDMCLDALALSRELALDGEDPGQSASSAGMMLAYHPCAEALDVAPLERKREAAGQLSRLAEGFPPFSRVMKQASVRSQLTAFGTMMPAELLAALPAGAQYVVKMRSTGELSSSYPLAARLIWRKTVKGFGTLIAAADQTPAARKRAFAAYDEGIARELFPYSLANGAFYDKVAGKMDLARLQHDALRALVEADLQRAEEGRWPERLTSRPHASFVLESTSPAEAHLRPCAPELEEQALRVTADGPPGEWARPTP